MTFRNHLWRGALPMVLAALLQAAPSTADEQRGWILRFGGVWMDAEVEGRSVTDDGVRSRVGLDGGLGGAITPEFRINRILGLEFGLLAGDPGLNVRVQTVGSSSEEVVRWSIDYLVVFAVAPNFHLLRDRSVDLYVAPVLARLTYEDLLFGVPRAGQPEQFTSESDTALGAQVGVDIGDRDKAWAVNISLRYLDSRIKTVGGEVGLDPLIFGLGAAYRF
jgi:hypothetical protein